MKYIITEDQLEKIKDSILKIPFSSFNDNWDVLQKFLNKRGNPLYILKGDVNLAGNKKITTLGNLISVEGNLHLEKTSIQSLENLTSVGGDLNLYGAPIKSLGNLKSVGGSIYMVYSDIETLGNLTSVGGELRLELSKFKSLGDLTTVGGSLFLQDSNVESLGKLTYVGGVLSARNTWISQRYTEKAIKDYVDVGYGIYL